MFVTGSGVRTNDEGGKTGLSPYTPLLFFLLTVPRFIDFVSFEF